MWENVRCVNLPRGNKSYLHIVKKKVTRNFDSSKLDYIQKNIGLPCVREQIIEDTRLMTPNHVRIPDFTINKQVIGELDSVKTHGELGFENNRTLKRNTDYFLINRPFFVINEDLSKHLHLDQAKLGNYLYYHSLMYFQALENYREMVTY